MKYDVIVIGGGPAGMMAAGRGAARGAHVILLEKNDTLGKKLLISGGGRCNVTNNQPDNRLFLEKFPESNKFLFSAFARWNVQSTLSFFHDKDMPTKVENELRVFPVSNSSKSVWDVLHKYMEDGNVTIQKNSPVTGFLHENNIITGVTLQNGKTIQAKAFILATGGNSHPETGSTGDGFSWARELGHRVVDIEPSLVPLALNDTWAKKLQGISLKDIKLSLVQNGKKHETRTGTILFTHFGVTGPAILNMSNSVGELLPYGDVSIVLDLLPALNHKDIDIVFQNIYSTQAKKRVKNISSNLLPSAVLRAVSELAGIDVEIPCNSVSREQRKALIQLLKALPLHISHVLGLDKAVITSGGVDLKEVDFKTMQSKLFPNLYLVGDVLNINRPSGGYSLQLCWTTGFIAGDSVLYTP
ncbi:MAG: aminoacetone oxidase family FAD-binding enzyme [bacterium]|nr:aminoacetone oxidase family FAD-binding enzyme [bacterium]